MKQKTHIQNPSNLSCHSICANLCIQARAPVHVHARSVAFKLELNLCGFVSKQLIIFSQCKIPRDTINSSVSLHMINASAHEKETRMLLSVTGYCFMLQSMCPQRSVLQAAETKEDACGHQGGGVENLQGTSGCLTRYNGKKWR